LIFVLTTKEEIVMFIRTPNKGCFIQHEDLFTQFYLPTEDPTADATDSDSDKCLLKYMPKLDPNQWKWWLDVVWHFAQQSKEVRVDLFLSPADNQVLLAIPEQRVCSSSCVTVDKTKPASIKYLTFDGSEITGEDLVINNFKLIGDCHSHHTMPIDFSATDDADDKHFAGIHLLIKSISFGANTYELLCSVTNSKTSKSSDINRFIFSNTLLDFPSGKLTHHPSTITPLVEQYVKSIVYAPVGKYAQPWYYQQFYGKKQYPSIPPVKYQQKTVKYQQKSTKGLSKEQETMLDNVLNQLIEEGVALETIYDHLDYEYLTSEVELDDEYLTNDITNNLEGDFYDYYRQSH
jgi:hypothetical protein